MKSLIEDVLLEQKKADQLEFQTFQTSYLDEAELKTSEYLNLNSDTFVNENLSTIKNKSKYSDLSSICNKESESNYKKPERIIKNKIIRVITNPIVKASATNIEIDNENSNFKIESKNNNSIIDQSNENSKEVNQLLNENKKYCKKSPNISDLKQEMIELLKKGPNQIYKDASLEELDEKDNYLSKKIDRNIKYLQKFISVNKNKPRYSNDHFKNLIQVESDINLTSYSNILPKKLVRKLPVNSYQSQLTFNSSVSNIVKLDYLNDFNSNSNFLPKKKLNLYSSLNYDNLKLLEKDSLEKQIVIEQNNSETINLEQTELNNPSNDKKTNSNFKLSTEFLKSDKIIIKKTLEESDCKFGQNRSKFICTECGIKLKKLAILKKHLLSHTNLKPYKCKICHSKFTTKGNLVKHLKTKAHITKCVCSGMNENDEKISKITNENIDYNALDAQMEIKKKIRISRQ